MSWAIFLKHRVSGMYSISKEKVAKEDTKWCSTYMLMSPSGGWSLANMERVYWDKHWKIMLQENHLSHPIHTEFEAVLFLFSKSINAAVLGQTCSNLIKELKISGGNPTWRNWSASVRPPRLLSNSTAPELFLTTCRVWRVAYVQGVVCMEQAVLTLKLNTGS